MALVSSFLRSRKYPLLLCAAALAVFAPALGNGFVDWDDLQYVVQNPALRGGWLDALTFSPGYYHPLTTLTYKLEFLLFGLAPLPYHLTNLLLHAACCAAVYGFLLELGSAAPAAFLAGAIFCVHPLHAEPVAWVSGRKELLWGLFYFLSLTRYARYLAGGEKRQLRLALLLFLPAALAKPAALTLPLALPLLDWYRGRRLDMAAMLEKLPFAAAAAAFFLLSSAPAGFLLENTTGSVSVPGALASWLHAAFFYLGKFAVPLNLSALYPRLSLPLPAALYLPAALAACAGAGLWLARDPAGPGPGLRRKAAFGLLLFGVTALPGLIVSPPADRFMYVPAAALCFVCAELFSALYSRQRGKPARPLLAAAFAACLLLLAGASFRRARLWRDSFALWNSVLAANPAEPVAWYGRGNAARAAGAYDAAAADYTRCLELDPGYWRALANRGRISAELGGYGRATADYTEALKFNPGSPQLLLNRGNAFALAGLRAEALRDYDAALAAAPGFTAALEGRRALGAQSAGAARRAVPRR